MILEEYNIDVHATSRHRSSILEHRIVLQDLVYIYIYIYIGVSIFLVCSPNVRSLMAVKRDFHFCVRIFRSQSLRCVSFSKTDESGRIARTIFLQIIEYRARNGISCHDRTARVHRAREGSANGLPKRRFAPVYELFFISTSREQITTTFGSARPFTLSDDIYLVVFTKDEEFVKKVLRFM